MRPPSQQDTTPVPKAATVPMAAPTSVATGVAVKPVEQTQGQGKSQPVEVNNIEKLKELKGLLDLGVLTQEEFDAQKTAILDVMQKRL